MKIGFCGTMSVGKTTLVNALKELPEFKNYKFRTERSKYLMEMGIPLNTDSTYKGQLVFAAERAAELMPLDPIVNDHLGDVYWAVDRRDEARFQWQRALSFDPEKKDMERIYKKLDIGLDAVLTLEKSLKAAVDEN